MTHDDTTNLPHLPLSCLIERALGERPDRLTPLHGGCVSEVYRAHFAKHPDVAVKHEPEIGRAPGLDTGLETEGFMLDHLAGNTALPLPRVLHAEPSLLVLDYVEHDGARSPEGERALADLMADLHGAHAAGHGFGLERATRIGPLTQPNTPTASWSEFYRDQRLVPFGALAHERGTISDGAYDDLRRLAGDLGRWLAGTEGDPPALLHGDLWSGNILWDRGFPKALIDPACYRGHPEVELAFMDLMGGLGRAFWGRYLDRRPHREGWEDRRTIYQLYPLLVHAALFGGGYGQSVSRALASLGV